METPARPELDLPFAEPQPKPPYTGLQLVPAPSKPAPAPLTWWQDPVTVGGLVTLLVGVVTGREWHKRRRRRRADAHANAISKDPVR